MRLLLPIYMPAAADGQVVLLSNLAAPLFIALWFGKLPHGQICYCSSEDYYTYIFWRGESHNFIITHSQKTVPSHIKQVACFSFVFYSSNTRPGLQRRAALLFVILDNSLLRSLTTYCPDLQR